jgi:hypothetical protein
MILTRLRSELTFVCFGLPLHLALQGYFRLLLRQIEEHLTTLNVRLLTALVDPEMAPIWSKKLGFTVLSNEEVITLLFFLFPAAHKEITVFRTNFTLSSDITPTALT